MNRLKFKNKMVYAALATLCIGQASMQGVSASATAPDQEGATAEQQFTSATTNVHSSGVDVTKAPPVEILPPLLAGDSDNTAEEEEPGSAPSADEQLPQEITTNATYMDVLTEEDTLHTYTFTVTGKTKVTWQYKHVEQAVWKHTLFGEEENVIGTKLINSASHGLFTTYEKILAPGTYYMTITGNDVALNEHYTFTLTEVLPKAFDDVPLEHPYHDEIGAIQQMGIITGFENNTFEPNTFIQRKHIAAMIMRAEANVKLLSTPQNFVDVPYGHPYYQDIMGLYRSNIIDGKQLSDGVYFEPDAQITRSQLAKILVNAFTIEAADDTTYYEDITPDNWYYESANILASNGIFFDNTAVFNGDLFVTRAEFAHFLYRAMHVAQDEQ